MRALLAFAIMLFSLNSFSALNCEALIQLEGVYHFQGLVLQFSTEDCLVDFDSNQLIFDGVERKSSRDPSRVFACSVGSQSRFDCIERRLDGGSFVNSFNGVQVEAYKSMLEIHVLPSNDLEWVYTSFDENDSAFRTDKFYFYREQ